MIELNLLPAANAATQGLYQQAVSQLQGLVQSGIARFQPDVFIDQVHAFRDRLIETGSQIPVLSRLFSRFDDLHSDSELTPDHAQALFEQLKSAPLPSLVPGHEAIEMVGSGGYSRVYRGIESATGGTVAIKVAAKSKIADRTESSSGLMKLQQAFDNERNMLSRFKDSERVVNAHAYGVTDRDKPYIVMEYLPGGTMSQYFGLVNAGLATFDLDVVLPMMLGAARALAELHGVGIIHNDIKASNFLLAGDGRVKLADLAMATTVEEARAMSANRGRRGTPGFIAPQTTEALRNDVFALGTVFYRALTGQSPYSDKVQTLMRLSPMLALGNKAKKPSEVCPERNLPKRFDGILLKAVTMDAAKRYADAGALASDLEKITRKKPRRRQ